MTVIKQILVLISVIILFTLPVSAQDDKGISGRIEVAIKAGNANELANYFIQVSI